MEKLLIDTERFAQRRVVATLPEEGSFTTSLPFLVFSFFQKSSFRFSKYLALKRVLLSNSSQTLSVRLFVAFFNVFCSTG